MLLDKVIIIIHTEVMKELFILQVKEQMKIQGIRKNKLSESIGCSRATLDRVLDKDNNNVHLDTLYRIAKELGFSLSFKLVDEMEGKWERT